MTHNPELFHGDCFDILPELREHSVDLICVDLPYQQTSRNSWDIMLPMCDFIEFEEKLWNKESFFLEMYKRGLPYNEACNIWNGRVHHGLWFYYKRILKERGLVILFGNGRFSAFLIDSNPKWYRYSLVWQKTQPVGFLNANKMPLRSHEDLLIFYDKLPVYHPQMTSGHIRKVCSAKSRVLSKEGTDYGNYNKSVSYDSTDRYPTSVWTFSKDTQKEALHPTQKPVALLENIIRTYTNEGALVLDHCMGSGSTGVAAIKTGRKFIGIEKDDRYYEVAKNRIFSLREDIEK